MTDRYNIVLEQEQSTVVAKYEATVLSPDAYQSEAKLEASFIRQLTEQGYEYLPKLTGEADLIANLRKQLELLNDYRFTDHEWTNFFSSEIARENMTIDEKTQIIQRDYVLLLTCDNGENRNIRLLDKRNIHNNRLQVINQYVPEGGTAKNRYDVTILVNGLPLVHVELKARGVDIKQAFNQIARYQRESFWAGKALFDYVQIFVISNGTHTKYYSNTTRFAKEDENLQQKPIRRKTESNSFEFTSWWSDEQNNQLPDLRAFTETFFAKHTILLAVPVGQMEAGRSLGLTKAMTMRYIILPQAIKNVIPPIGNEFITLLKETAIVGYVSLNDLTRVANLIQSRTYEAFMPLIGAAVIYFTVIKILTLLLSQLERRMRKSDNR